LSWLTLNAIEMRNYVSMDKLLHWSTHHWKDRCV
jgi:hypothetical protein